MNPVPPPFPPPRTADLPHPLTFFLNGRDRAAVLRALRRIAPGRATALLAALGLTPPPDPGESAHAPPTHRQAAAQTQTRKGRRRVVRS